MNENGHSKVLKRKSVKKSDEDDVNITTCKECFAIFEKELTHCPACGNIVPQTAGREISQEDGELVEIDPNIIRIQKKQENRAARTLEELVALGKSRGYPKAEAWATKQIQIREQYRAKR